MPTPTQVTLNPGAGGASIAVDQQSASSPFGVNADMPVSEIVFSKDGVADSLPVTGVNPLPVGGINPATGAMLAPSVVPENGVNELATSDAVSQRALHEMLLALTSVSDTLANAVLQVQATLRGDPAGSPSLTNVIPVQGVPGGKPLGATVTSPGGNTQTVSPVGPARVEVVPQQLFYEAWDGATANGLDTVNKWTAPVVTGGASFQYLQAGPNIFSGTSANGAVYFNSQYLFQPTVPGMISSIIRVNIENTPPLLNAYRFWGFANVQTNPTAANPISDGYGWEVNTDGNLYAVTYAGGVRTVWASVVQPTDGGEHAYQVDFRGELAYWYLDGKDAPLATMPSGVGGPGFYALPLAFICIAGSTPPTSSAQLLPTGIFVGSTGALNGVRDATYPFRAAAVKAALTAPTTSDAALTVAMSPNTPIALNESGTQVGIPIKLGVVNVGSDDLSALLSVVVTRLDSILWVLVKMTGKAPPSFEEVFSQ